MGAKHLLFRAMYRLGFTPWDGHPLAASLRGLVEGPAPLRPGRALDLGCGTGDSSIYLAKKGWQVTGVDFVGKPLGKARAKAAGEKVDVDFVQADVTRLGSGPVGAGFDFIVDTGCLHGMSDQDRDAYAREVSAVASPDARLLIVAFVTGGAFGVPGIESDEIERRFAPTWTLLSSGHEPSMDRNGKNPARHYLFQRRNT